MHIYSNTNHVVTVQSQLFDLEQEVNASHGREDVVTTICSVLTALFYYHAVYADIIVTLTA